MACILLIDDDPSLRAILAKTLGYAGHTVYQASEGKEGVDIFRATPVDLVITDLIMPGQEGIETMMQLRRESPDLRIIAMSGGIDNSSLYLQLAGKLGAQRTLAKPFTSAEFLQTIDEVLARPGPPDAKPA
ncbi:MAG: response regulator [Opitutus sp.]|nr:response regulator [Opitutus sp.]